MSLTQKEVEAAVLKDYEDVLGKIVLVSEVMGYRGDNSEEITLDPPVVARIVETRSDDLLRWNDEEFCDPYYDLDILSPHPALAGTRSHWMDGPARGVDGTVSPAALVVGDALMQANYRDALDLSEDHMGKVDGWVAPSALRAFTVAGPNGPIRVDADLGAVIRAADTNGLDMQRVDVDMLKEALGLNDLDGAEVEFEDVGYWNSKGIFEEPTRSHAMAM